MRLSRIISELRGSPDCGAEPPAILSPSRWRRVARRSKREVLERLLGGDCAGHPLALVPWFARNDQVGMAAVPPRKFGRHRIRREGDRRLVYRRPGGPRLRQAKASAQQAVRGERLPAVVNGTVDRHHRHRHAEISCAPGEFRGGNKPRARRDGIAGLSRHKTGRQRLVSAVRLPRPGACRRREARRRDRRACKTGR